MSLRDRRQIDPEIERDLDEIDRALAGDPAAEPALLDLAADVRADRVEPDAGFRAVVEGRIAEGFPAPAPGERAASPWRRRFLIAAPVVASAALALVVVVQTQDNSRQVSATLDSLDSPVTESSATEALRGRGRAPEASGAVPGRPVAPDAATSTPAPDPSATSPLSQPPETLRPDREVQRSADISLTTQPDELQDVAGEVVRTTQSVGGYVQDSSISARPDDGDATFTLRIPSARLDEALAKLSGLADVGALSQDSTDITGPVDSVSDRLSDARAERRGLQRALAGAQEESQVARLRERLRQTSARVAGLTGELQALRRQADLSTVAVSLSAGAPRDGADDDEGGAWTPGDALRDAGRVLEVSGGILLIVAAVLVPLLLVAVLAVAAMRGLRRHRREAAL